MTFRTSLVLVGCLSLAGACLAIERTPSAVEVEEGTDSSASLEMAQAAPDSEESEVQEVAPRRVARKPVEQLEIEVGAEPPETDEEADEDDTEGEPERKPEPVKRKAKKPVQPVVDVEAEVAEAPEAPAKTVKPKAAKPALVKKPAKKAVEKIAEPVAEPAVEAPSEPVVAEAPAAPVAPPVPAAQAERLKAFAKGPIRFTSVGKIKAFMIKMDRNLEYTMKPIPSEEAVAVTMVDHANGDKVVEGRLDVAKDGALRAHDLPLTNACNIGSIDPVVRKKLLAGETAVTSRGQMEISGNVQAIEATHEREGEVAADGSMKIKSVVESADGKVHLTTITDLAPDGLPTLAETTGTIAKGPINLNVNLKLTREVGPTAIGE